MTRCWLNRQLTGQPTGIDSVHLFPRSLVSGFCVFFLVILMANLFPVCVCVCVWCPVWLESRVDTTEWLILYRRPTMQLLVESRISLFGFGFLVNFMSFSPIWCLLIFFKRKRERVPEIFFFSMPVWTDTMCVCVGSLFFSSLGLVEYRLKEITQDWFFIRFSIFSLSLCLDCL